VDESGGRAAKFAPPRSYTPGRPNPNTQIRSDPRSRPKTQRQLSTPVVKHVVPVEFSDPNDWKFLQLNVVIVLRNDRYSQRHGGGCYPCESLTGMR
jgi:hypothetical protein